MKHVSRLIFLLSYCFCSVFLYSLEQELNQFTQQMMALSQSLSPRARKYTYQELRRIIQPSFQELNADLLDRYDQTPEIQIAKYLLVEIKKKPDIWQRGAYQVNRYIPLAAYVTQQLQEKYTIDQTIRCVSLASGNLANEMMLMLGLWHAGYKKIHLSAIDIIYTQEKKIQIQDTFTEILTHAKIPFSFDPFFQENGIRLELFQDAYTYIQEVQDGIRAKNDLFFMIQPGGAATVLNQADIVETLNKTSLRQNYLRFVLVADKKASHIACYFPYVLQNFFITSEASVPQFILEESIQLLLNQKTWSANALIKEVVEKQLPLLRTMGFGISPTVNHMSVSQNVFLTYVDLLKYTSVNPKGFLSFNTLDLRLNEITAIADDTQQALNEISLKEH